MKFYFCIVGILCALALVKSDHPDEVEKLFEECAKEVGLSEDALKEKPNFDDPKLRCFSACTMKKTKSMIDNKVVLDKTIELIGKHFPGGATDEIRADIKECTNKANEEKEECDVAGTFDKCFMEKHPLPKE